MYKTLQVNAILSISTGERRISEPSTVPVQGCFSRVPLATCKRFVLQQLYTLQLLPFPSQKTWEVFAWHRGSANRQRVAVAGGSSMTATMEIGLMFLKTPKLVGEKQGG